MQPSRFLFLFWMGLLASDGWHHSGNEPVASELLSAYPKMLVIAMDDLHPNEDGVLLKTHQTSTSWTGKQPAFEKILNPRAFGEQSGTSFEHVNPGVFTAMKTNVGVWDQVQGEVFVDDQHARSGKQCLQVAGGEAASVVLTLKDDISTDGQLIFWAERWTGRAPFRFRIEKHTQGKWIEIYNGDKRVSVGRSFLCRVKIPLGDAHITQLRFSVTSPVNSGVLIDDLEIVSAESTPVQQGQEINELGFARPFGDHMVLQAEQPVRIWGTGKPGAEVVINFPQAKLKETARVNQNGVWKVELKPQPVNRIGQTIALSSGGQTVEIKDVLFGDVWICAGQSNMEWELRKSTGGQKAIANAADNLLRLHNCPAGARGGGVIYGDKQMEHLWPTQFSEGTWRVAANASAADFSAVGYYFAANLRAELNRPIGMINVSVGGTPIESWISRSRLSSHPTLAKMFDGNWLENPILDAWCKGRASLNLKRGLAGECDLPRDEFGPNHSFKPGFMYEAGIQPFSSLAIRGGLWYQGESNAENPSRTKIYDLCFPLLVDDWRASFQNEDLPIIFVQLPGMGRANWPVFREYQRRSLANTRRVGMAVTIDTGHPTNVHPRDKKPVGNRLAQWALVEVYGRSGMPMGPLFKSKSVKGASLEITFDFAGRKLSTNDGQPAHPFEIAGSDGVYHPANATLVGNKVRLTSRDVPRPVHARYAWSAFPEPKPNLVNSDGLPASPFVTEENFH